MNLISMTVCMNVNDSYYMNCKLLHTQTLTCNTAKTLIVALVQHGDCCMAESFFIDVSRDFLVF